MNTFAVVPIFVNTGAAVLPLVVAFLSGIAAAAMRPGDVMRACRRHPLRSMGVVLGMGVVLAVLVWGVHFLMSERETSKTAAGPTRYDWARVALRIIALEQAGSLPTAMAAEPSGLKALIQGRDASRSSYDGGPSPLGLKMLWTYDPQETMFFSQPLAAGNRVFVAGNQSEPGSYGGMLACLDARTGKPIWEVTHIDGEVGKPYFSSPALTADGKWLIIGQGLHEDRGSSLLCFDAATGKLRWRVKTLLHVESSPVIFGDLVAVGVGAIEGQDGKPMGDPGYVMAVNITSGKLVWKQTVGDPESSPAADEKGVVYVGSGVNGNAVVAMRSETDDVLKARKLERVIWKTPTAYPMTSPITLVGDLVISGGGNGDMVNSHANPTGVVMALDRKTGAIKWKVELADSVLGNIAAREGVLVCSCRTGEVVALNQADGSVLWKTWVNAGAPVLAGSVFTGTYVYAMSNDGCLVVIDAKTGKKIEKLFMNAPGKPGTALSFAGGWLSEGRLIVASETGGVKCLIGSQKQP